MFKKDELVHDTGTLEGFAGCLDRAADIDQGRMPLTDADAKSIWLAHGTADYICDFRGSERWFNEDCKVKDRTLQVYEGWRHRSKFCALRLSGSFVLAHLIRCQPMTKRARRRKSTTRMSQTGFWLECEVDSKPGRYQQSKNLIMMTAHWVATSSIEILPNICVVH